MHWWLALRLYSIQQYLLYSGSKCIALCWRCASLQHSSPLVVYFTFSFHHRNKGPKILSCRHEPAVWGCVEWLISCSGLFGCLPLWASRMKQLPQQQKLIAMITEVLPSGATQRERNAHTHIPPAHALNVPGQHFPSLNTFSRWITKLRDLTERLNY